MKTPNFLSFSLLLLLKYCLRLLIGAWLLREYVERASEEDGEEERARSGGGTMALGLFLTSGVEALVRASASFREEKRKKRRWCDSFVSLALMKSNNTIKKMVDTARAMSGEEKLSVGEMLLSASFMVACAAILAVYASEGQTWPAVYVTAILMNEMYERRFTIEEFISKHIRRNSWRQYDDDDDDDQQTIPKIGVGAFADAGDKIYLVGKYRDQLFDRIVDGTHQIIHRQKCTSSNIGRYFPPSFADHHIRKGMVSTEGTCPRFLCFAKEDTLNNILAFTKEDANCDDLDEAANESTLRTKIANGLASLIMTSGETTTTFAFTKEDANCDDLDEAPNESTLRTKIANGLASLIMTSGETTTTTSTELSPSTERKNNTIKKEEKELHMDNVGVMFKSMRKRDKAKTLLNTINDIGVGRAFVSGRHFVFLKNPPASIASDANIARFFASKTCVYTTNDIAMLKKHTRVVFANRRDGEVSYVGTFASLLTQKNFGSELAKSFLSRKPAEREEDRDDEMYSEPVAKIETGVHRLLRCFRKGNWCPTVGTIVNSDNRATLLAFSAMIVSLILIAALNAENAFIDSTAFIVSVFAPIFLCILLDLAYTKTWIQSILIEQKHFYKTVAFGTKIHVGIEEIIYSGFSFRFKAILCDVANEYTLANTAILHELVVKTVVILSFIVLMVASHFAFFESAEFSFENSSVRAHRAASTFLALVVARDSLCSFLENLSKNSVFTRRVARTRSIYDARNIETKYPKKLRRTRSMF